MGATEKIIMEQGLKTKPEISVVVLCYQAGESIRQFVINLSKLMENKFGHDFELVLVGNYHQGSDDPTPLIINDIASHTNNIISVIKPKKGMMGWDMRLGLSAASGKNLAVIDGDNQMPIQDLIRVYDLLKKDNLDLAKTYRIERGDKLWRKFISFFYNISFKILFPGLGSKDINSKPKILTRQAYDEMSLESDDWFIDAEIMIQARRLDLKIGELPTSFRGLGGSRKSFVKLSAILEFTKNLIIFRWKEKKSKKV